MAARENEDGGMEETGDWRGEEENGEVIDARERLIHPFTLLVSKCSFLLSFNASLLLTTPFPSFFY